MVLGVEYRKRFGNNPDLSSRSDMLAMTASVDLPFFRKNRLNNVISATAYQVQAAEQSRLVLKRVFLNNYSKFRSQKEVNVKRLKLYEIQIINEAYNNKKAALQAYQNGKNDFSTLLNAQILVLNTEIEIVNLKTEILKATTQLLYFVNYQEIQNVMEKIL